jgi:hypothetical protein
MTRLLTIAFPQFCAAPPQLPYNSVYRDAACLSWHHREKAKVRQDHGNVRDNLP